MKWEYGAVALLLSWGISVCLSLIVENLIPYAIFSAGFLGAFFWCLHLWWQSTCEVVCEEKHPFGVLFYPPKPKPADIPIAPLRTEK